MPDSPAAAAKIEPGDTITSAEIVLPKEPTDDKTPEPH